MNLLKFQTNKLFYNKWPYKISCKIDGIHLLRFYNFKLNFLGVESLKYYRGKINFDFEKLKFFCLIAQKFIEDKNIKKRIENKTINFYVLNEEMLNEIEHCLSDFIYSITSPSNYQELETLQSENNYIFCKNLPHKNYRFKVTFKEMPLNIRQNLINWAEKYNNDDIYINNSTKVHFKGIKYKYGTHYFYIKDKKMLSFIMLAASGYVRKTDEFIVRESLTTV